MTGASKSLDRAGSAHQDARRALRVLGHPTEHETSFVATAGVALVGEAVAKVRQRCGTGLDIATTTDANLNLLAILGWLGKVLFVLQDLIRSRARLFP